MDVVSKHSSLQTKNAVEFLTDISENKTEQCLLSFAALYLYGIRGVNASPKRGPQLLLGQPL